ncbi:IS630 family transposase, partial [Streptococcus sp. 19428wA2_WM07]|nr:IS630 family transposase [Streptococcus sp. 19428wA2_WM07]MBF0806970.1 IS630 family transposase [Streptococcus sp. 19428wA2_WM07]
AFKSLNEVIDQLQEVIQSLSTTRLRSIVHREWISANFDSE